MRCISLDPNRDPMMTVVRWQVCRWNGTIEEEARVPSDENPSEFDTHEMMRLGRQVLFFRSAGNGQSP